jgi:hypothetical protein
MALASELWQAVGMNLKTIDVECPTCGAQVGRMCVYTTGEQRGAHRDRTKLAKKAPKEDLSQTDSEQLAAELCKRADETRKRAKPGEDASQAAARIVREATEGK